VSAGVRREGDDRLCLWGDVTFDIFNAVRADAERELGGTPAGRIEFDCTELEAANSLSVALFMALLRAANRSGKNLVLTGVAPSLAGIIEFSGLTEVLLPDA
jgi:anti-anti-sigma regulatory factor